MKVRTGLLAMGLAGSLLGCGDDGGVETVETRPQSVNTTTETPAEAQSERTEPRPYRNEVYITEDGRAAELRIINSYGQTADTVYVRCLGAQAIVRNFRSEDTVVLDEFSAICDDGELTRTELGRLG